MTAVNAAVVVVVALLGALWGWRVGTKRIYRRSVFGDDNEGRGHNRWRRRVLQRYWTTALYAALTGAPVALLILMMSKR
ncbi:hypothetical protein BH11PSE3_BH11PSE3_18790 [soil metagenome]